MNIKEIMSITKCDTLKELNEKFNFKLRQSKHDGVILEELGVFTDIDALIAQVDMLTYEGIYPEDLKVSLLKK